MIDARDLQFSYPGGVRAVDGVSLSAKPGQFIGIHGASGCGKSTLLFLLGGLLHPQGGSVEVDGLSLYDLSSEQRAKARGDKIGFVFQQFHLVPYLTVRENVLAANLAGGQAEPARADALLGQFGLEHRASHVPSRLSVGEQQRAALARALLREPPVVLADEPTGNLDAENRDRLLQELSAYAAAGHVVLMVSHDETALAAASTTIQLQEGRIV